MTPNILPPWAAEHIRLKEYISANTPWHKENENTYSRIVQIVYPTGVHYRLERLEEDAKWHELEGYFYSVELAQSNAAKRAYLDGVPYRIKEVIWDG